MKGIAKFSFSLSIPIKHKDDLYQQCIETRSEARSGISDILMDSFKVQEHLYANIVYDGGKQI